MEGKFQHLLLLLLALMPVLSSSSSSSSSPSSSPFINTRKFHFNVEWKTITRLCHSKALLTVNGKYPGPTISVNEGDHVQVTVTNKLQTNTTIHWHGVRQLRSGWADGPAYITQCPIGGGKTYTYNFDIVDQRGTLWWHAHFSWQRASVYGAFVINPRKPFPFTLPIQPSYIPLIFGEWWNEDVELVENEMMTYGGGPANSDAYTINGLPGPLYPCSTKDTFIQTVVPGKTYLVRIINAALNDNLFFAVANHTLTVVEIDGIYTKPFPTTAIVIAPGQTTNVLLNADQIPGPTGIFTMAATPYLTSVFPFDNSTTIAFLQYQTNPSPSPNPNPNYYTLPQNLPTMKDTLFATQFFNSLRSLGSKDYPCKVPKTINKRVITTISLNLQDCPTNQTCRGFQNKRFFASMNNQSFIRPSTSILESHYRNLTLGYSPDFPQNPPLVFNYTGVDPVTENMNTNFGTKVLRVPYGTKLEIVLQNTNYMNPESHPIHVHGHNFFIVGRGFGNYDAAKDPLGYNLVDPPERNTVAVPMGGWAAIRLVTDNPGVWFVHCHLEEHTSWGLAMGLVVENGKESSQCLLPPPTDLPSC